MRITVLVLLAVTVAVLRFVLPTHGLTPGDVYKDLAHLFVGGLFGAWAMGRGTAQRKAARLCFWLGWGLVAVELVAFFARK